MNGMLTKTNIFFFDKNEFDKNIITETDNYIFVSYKPVNTKNIIRNINLWKNKYPNFGLIISSKGILIDCSQYYFEIENKTNLENDLYYQSIAHGIISIRNEYINHYI